MKIEVSDFTYACIKTVQAVLNEAGNKQGIQYDEDSSIQIALITMLMQREKKETLGGQMISAIDNIKDMQKAIELERKMQK